MPEIIDQVLSGKQTGATQADATGALSPKEIEGTVQVEPGVYVAENSTSIFVVRRHENRREKSVA